MVLPQATLALSQWHFCRQDAFDSQELGHHDAEVPQATGEIAGMVAQCEGPTPERQQSQLMAISKEECLRPKESHLEKGAALDLVQSPQHTKCPVTSLEGQNNTRLVGTEPCPLDVARAVPEAQHAPQLPLTGGRR